MLVSLALMVVARRRGLIVPARWRRSGVQAGDPSLSMPPTAG